MAHNVHGDSEQTPAFVADDRIRRKRILAILLRLLVVFLAMLAIATATVFVQTKGNILIVGFMGSILCLSWVLMKRDNVQAASIILIAGCWIPVTVFIALSGGMRGPGMMHYVSLIVIAGLLLGPIATIVTIIFSAIAGGGMVLYEMTGHAMPYFFPVPSIAGWINLVLMCSLVAAVMNVTQQQVNQALKIGREQLFQRQKTEEILRLNEARLEALLRLNELHSATISELVHFAMEEAVRLTSSKVGYIAFTDDEERNLIMYAWSKEAMAECRIDDKPIVYPIHKTGLWGEAIRQRKAIITNDYQMPNLWKKGLPEGHVSIAKHMNIPLFDESRIVLVAGVGNKETDYDLTDVRQLELLMSGMWQIVQKKNIEAEIHHLNQELERRVQERTAQLESANNELESFSYSVSHDLRAPLRAIDGFSQALEEDCGKQFDETAHQYLRRIRSAAQRMGELIDGLLTLSHISRSGLSRELIDLSECARRIINDLQRTELTRSITWSVQPGLTAFCDPGMILAALENLLGNAWKFTSLQQSPSIEFGACEQNNSTVFFVRDNGAGFNMEYADKLFGAFQRLHRTEEFPGTGIGLATTQRIIHRHGGTIWVDSVENQGSTFYFTLPDPRSAVLEST